jgi:hypothetical protein
MDSVNITINIGGRSFHTTKTTLSKSKYFKKLLKKSWDPKEMIDKDPTAFRQVLRLMRFEKSKIDSKYEPDLIMYGVKYTKDNLINVPESHKELMERQLIEKQLMDKQLIDIEQQKINLQKIEKKLCISHNCYRSIVTKQVFTKVTYFSDKEHCDFHTYEGCHF